MSEALVFLVMLALFMAGAFWFKMPVGIAMILASIGGTLAAGEGVPVRHLFEGSMGFLDTMLVVATAMIFMKVVEATGALEHIGRVIVRVFAGRPAFWGPFDTPYTDHDEGYYWEKYNGWYNIRELGLSGGVGQVAVNTAPFGGFAPTGRPEGAVLLDVCSILPWPQENNVNRK